MKLAQRKKEKNQFETQGSYHINKNDIAMQESKRNLKIFVERD